MKKVLTPLVFAAMIVPALAEGNRHGAHFLENWDLDGDGAVSLDDITIRRGDVFMMFDVDEDGMLDATEYVLFDETRAADMENNAGHRKGMRRASEGMSLPFNDIDGDGAVSRKEFLARSDDWMVILDRDDNGLVTPKDFGPRQKEQ